jgi:hypothetical protein
LHQDEAQEARRIRTCSAIRDWRSRQSAAVFATLLRAADEAREAAESRIEQVGFLGDGGAYTEINLIITQKLDNALAGTMESARADLERIVARDFAPSSTSRGGTTLEGPAGDALVSVLAVALPILSIGAGGYVAGALAVSSGLFLTTVNMPLVVVGAGLATVGLATGALSPYVLRDRARRRIAVRVNALLKSALFGSADGKDPGLFEIAFSAIDDAAKEAERVILDAG